MTVTCTQCGTGSPPGNRFCGQCGSPLPPSPGNVARSTRPAPGPPPPATGWAAAATPCWRCGNAVDPTRQPTCPTCGAALAAPLHPVTVPPPPAPVPVERGSGWSAPPAAPPAPTPIPFGGDGRAGGPASGRDESKASPVLTVVVAIGIVLLLAVLGILAGQLIGR